MCSCILSPAVGGAVEAGGNRQAQRAREGGREESRGAQRVVLEGNESETGEEAADERREASATA